MHKRRPFWFLRRPDVASDVDEELQLHFDMRVAELMGKGQRPEDARQTALRQFGDVEATRRYCRQQDEHVETATQRGLLFNDVVQDLRIAFRGLLGAPALALTIVASVGLGLGATAAIFSAIEAVLLRPLPYAEPDRLVRIYTDTPPPHRSRFCPALFGNEHLHHHESPIVDRHAPVVRDPCCTSRHWVLRRSVDGGDHCGDAGW